MIRAITLSKATCTAALILILLAYNAWPFAWENFFSQAQAACFVLLFFALYSSLKTLSAEIGLWYAINNLLDEIFFDPYKYQWNEYCFAIIVALFIIYKRRKNARNATG